MFGYIKAFTAELKMKDYDIYRGMYCSLCKTLGKRYGVTARMLLSYDLSFFALFLSALEDDCCGFKEGRCPFNPTKKCKYTASVTPGLEQAADACVILSYFKAIDNLHDSPIVKKIAAAAAFPFIKIIAKKAKRLNPEFFALAQEYMDAQKLVEQNRSASIDLAAEPSAKLLAELFSLGESNDDQKSVRSRLGYCIGRWIYLIDACDDYLEDTKTNNYNPYVYLQDKNTAGIAEKMKGDLNRTAAEAAAAFELLDMHRFRDIIENILYDGLYYESEAVLKKRFEQKPQ